MSRKESGLSTFEPLPSKRKVPLTPPLAGVEQVNLLVTARAMAQLFRGGLEQSSTVSLTTEFHETQCDPVG